jgi:hypothetical protein
MDKKRKNWNCSFRWGELRRERGKDVGAAKVRGESGGHKEMPSILAGQ